MSWNHRIVQKEDHYGDTYYEIHEVYYNKAGGIVGMTENPVAPFGESLKFLRKNICQFLDAWDHPVIVEKELIYQEWDEGETE